ncbi:MAG: response regulator [Bradyrhizobiaceae bacterium]|nr:MAG: response regulator [Bradyrhizobiaceae bacterium]
MDSTRPGGPSAASSAGLPDDVLIVEDDLLIAFDVKETVQELGVKSVRTAPSVARALEAIGEKAPDFALLDVALIREDSFAVAEELERLKIPFAFVTGYAADSTFPARFTRRPILNKPYVREALLAALQKWRETEN